MPPVPMLPLVPPVEEVVPFWRQTVTGLFQPAQAL